MVYIYTKSKQNHGVQLYSISTFFRVLEEKNECDWCKAKHLHITTYKIDLLNYGFALASVLLNIVLTSIN